MSLPSHKANKKSLDMKAAQTVEKVSKSMEHKGTNPNPQSAELDV